MQSMTCTKVAPDVTMSQEASAKLYESVFEDMFKLERASYFASFVGVFV